MVDLKFTGYARTGSNPVVVEFLFAQGTFTIKIDYPGFFYRYSEELHDHCTNFHSFAVTERIYCSSFFCCFSRRSSKANSDFVDVFLATNPPESQDIIYSKVPSIATIEPPVESRRAGGEGELE